MHWHQPVRNRVRNRCSVLCLSLRSHGAECILSSAFHSKLLRSLSFVIFRRLSPRYCCCKHSAAAGTVEAVIWVQPTERLKTLRHTQVGVRPQGKASFLAPKQCLSSRRLQGKAGVAALKRCLSSPQLFSLLYVACASEVHRLGRCGTPQHGLSSNEMARIISDCGAMRSLGIKWPESPRFVMAGSLKTVLLEDGIRGLYAGAAPTALR